MEGRRPLVNREMQFCRRGSEGHRREQSLHWTRRQRGWATPGTRASDPSLGPKVTDVPGNQGEALSSALGTALGDYET